MLDDLLELGEGAAGADQVAQLGDLVDVERGAEGGVEATALLGGERVERQGDQDGALALDEVVAGGLAGRRRVAEDAEDVVAQLEGLARAGGRSG